MLPARRSRGVAGSTSISWPPSFLHRCGLRLSDSQPCFARSARISRVCVAGAPSQCSPAVYAKPGAVVVHRLARGAGRGRVERGGIALGGVRENHLPPKRVASSHIGEPQSLRQEVKRNGEPPLHDSERSSAEHRHHGGIGELRLRREVDASLPKARRNCSVQAGMNDESPVQVAGVRAP